jgi:hypothetical protein
MHRSVHVHVVSATLLVKLVAQVMLKSGTLQQIVRIHVTWQDTRHRSSVSHDIFRLRVTLLIGAVDPSGVTDQCWCHSFKLKIEILLMLLLITRPIHYICLLDLHPQHSRTRTSASKILVRRNLIQVAVDMRLFLTFDTTRCSQLGLQRIHDT